VLERLYAEAVGVERLYAKALGIRRRRAFWCTVSHVIRFYLSYEASLKALGGHQFYAAAVWEHWEKLKKRVKS
jgi:hypothetical protein